MRVIVVPIKKGVVDLKIPQKAQALLRVFLPQKVEAAIQKEVHPIKAHHLLLKVPVLPVRLPQ